MSLQKDESTQVSSDSIYYKFIRLLHSIIVSIRENIALFIICLLIGIVPLLIKNYMDANLYKANFTVAYDELVRKIYGDRLTKINTIVQADQPKLIGDLLQVNQKAAVALKNVSGKNILGEDLTKDLNTDRVPFIVELTVDDSSQIVPLQNGIVKFLETGNEFMATRKTIKLQENKEELEYINRQLGVIDTVYKKGKAGETFVASTTSSTTSNTADKPAGSLIEFSYQLYKRKQELLRRERMPQTLTILDDAIVSVQKKKSNVLMAAIGAVAGFILYAVIAGIILPAFRFRER